MPKIDLKKFDAFLFDLDGTFVDGSDRHFVECVKKTGEELGYENLFIPPGAPLKNFLRTTLKGVSEELIEKFLEKIEYS
ncbi:hypothetical protein HZA38_01075 [Candidatus Peregrinibacteria bacterium]|nr:hypothetical protein [Candidatus Peregrinibacteria bacterium]